MNDELISQFLAFTGSADTSKATSYLEMSGGNVETAVGLFLEHQGGGGGAAVNGGAAAAAGGGPMMENEVRAPDATRTMRLMDDGPYMGSAMMGNPYMPMVDPMVEEHLRTTAFASMDVRETINAAANAAMAMDHDDEDDDEDLDYEYKEDDNDDDEEVKEVKPKVQPPSLEDMFAAPEHLIFKEGGFEGARSMAKDSKRWLLVNLQRNSEFSSHALNRDVWRDELVENLIREGFIFWQAMDISTEGKTYAQRYHVHDFPHIAIIDPRTRRLMWKKEGWTQENPMTAARFAEMAMDFCSRHSFDKPPVAPRPNGAAAANRNKRSMTEMSEDEQLQAAMRASLEDIGGDEDDQINDDQEDVQFLGTSESDAKPKAVETPKAEEPETPSLLSELLGMTLEDEPAKGARIQLRMPDGKRKVRKFDPSKTAKTIYAFVAQNNEEAKGGKEFDLKAGFPPKDLLGDIDETIENLKLSGETVTVMWKD
eukprot:scaffold2830_cov131-Cylindrotheca_fusiformis.AAC.27